MTTKQTIKSSLDTFRESIFRLRMPRLIDGILANGATAFILIYEKKKYVITAGHALCKRNQTIPVPIQLSLICVQNRRCLYNFELEILEHEDREIDLCILKLPNYPEIHCLDHISCVEDTPIQTENMSRGQKLEFFGYTQPYINNLTLLDRAEDYFQDGYPIAEKHTGIFHGIEEGTSNLLIENNTALPGVSGGPVIQIDAENPRNFRICGMAVRYPSACNQKENPNYGPGNTHPYVDGQMLVATSITEIIKMIEERPSGPKWC